MKQYFTVILLLITVLFSGCYKQDLSLCGLDDNLVLMLNLKDNYNNDILHNKIEKLDIVLFDEENSFVTHQKVLKRELADSNEVKLTVEPGIYRIVVWANITDESQLSEFKEGATFEGSYLETVSGVTGSNLYYGPRLTPKTRNVQLTKADNSNEDIYTVTVPAARKVQKEVNLIRAHRTVRVYVKGIENHPKHDGQNPLIQITNSPYRYDFLLQTNAGRVDYEQATTDVVMQNGGAMVMAEFSAPIGDILATQYVNVKRKTDRITTIPINLKQYIDNNDIPDLIDFDMLITVGVNANVTVTIPKWENVIVRPK